jgi:DNA polymerase
VAGDILEASAYKASLQREKHYHILNVLKCRPPENRDPTVCEIQNCRSFLINQLEVVKPKVIVAFGRYAQAFVLGISPNNISVLKNMGKVIKTPKFYAILSCHPAYIGRNRGGELEKAFKNHIRVAVRISKGAKPKCVVQNAPY